MERRGLESNHSRNKEYYCYMMGGTTGVVTYIYRKYGNIWLGVIPCALFAGLVTVSGFTLVR